MLVTFNWWTCTLFSVPRENAGLKWAYKLNSSSAGSRNLTSKGCMLKVNQLNQFYSHWWRGLLTVWLSHTCIIVDSLSWSECSFMMDKALLYEMLETVFALGQQSASVWFNGWQLYYWHILWPAEFHSILLCDRITPYCELCVVFM